MFSTTLRVVICFQKIVSLFWRTTRLRWSIQSYPLWFAFKKLYLCSDEQLYPLSTLQRYSCDLLSKNCIFVLTNNGSFNFQFLFYVVICFQKIVSLFWRTTRQFYSNSRYVLWFAFKKLYLCSDEQLKLMVILQTQVVICFQKIVSLFWRTTAKAAAEAELSCDLLSKNCIFVLTNNTRFIFS